MKLSDLPDAYRMQQTLEHCAAIEDELANEPLRIQIGNKTITAATDDPQRPLLEQAVRDFVAYLKRQATDKLAAYNIEADKKPSDYSGFPEDDDVAAID